MPSMTGLRILNRVGGPFGVLLYSPGLAQKVCEAGAGTVNSTLQAGRTRARDHRRLAREGRRLRGAAHVRTGRSGMREEAIDAVRSRKT